MGSLSSLGEEIVEQWGGRVQAETQVRRRGV